MSTTPRQADPLHDRFAQAGAQFVAYGPQTEEQIQIVETFGEYPAEYAAIRKGVGILDLPQRGILRFTGSDRKDFLHRMLTQEVNDLAGGSTRRAFQLNDKGRILADIILHHGDEDTWLEMDACDLPAVRQLYDQRLFADDVVMQDITDQRRVIALHGPAVLPLLNAIDARDAQAMIEMPGTHHVLIIAGQAVSAYRWDECGVPGVRLMTPQALAPELIDLLAAVVGGLVPDVDQAQGEPAQGGTKRPIKGRGIGWLAFNTARIEAGSPLFHVDFGPDSLPHETGPLLQETVSFTKGCYLGQEIVARMQNLGHPKKVLVGLKLDDERMPISGSQVFDSPDDPTGGNVVGAVTSATLSPMLGNRAIAFAMIKWGKHQPNTRVAVPAEGSLVTTLVHPLRFLG